MRLYFSVSFTRAGAIRCLMVAVLLGAGASRADGLADLKAALARLQAQAPVRATLDVRTSEQHGAGADAFENLGQVSVLLDDGARGLQVLYSKDTLNRMDIESRQLLHDPKARTPTVWALAKLDSAQMATMTSAAAALTRAIDESVFKAEKPDNWGGKAARRLSFTVPMTKLSEQQRKYIREFEGTLDVWIGADGTPLASAERVSVKGRAFVVISFEAIDEDASTYGVLGDRLLTLRSENHTVSSGAGEHGDTHIVRTLQPQP